MRHSYPRFYPGPTRSRINTFSESGAREIAQRIRSVWEKMGWDVDVRIERISSEEIGDGRSTAHFTVRSDLVNGMAQRRLTTPSAPRRPDVGRDHFSRSSSST